MRLLDDDGAENKTKVKVKVTLVIDDFIFSCLHFFHYIFVLLLLFLHLHVIDFIMLTNLLTTHNLNLWLTPFYYVSLIFPFILFIVPKLCFSKYRRDVERYGSCHSGEIRMDSMSRHQASFNKPVSFYIQTF